LIPGSIWSLNNPLGTLGKNEFDATKKHTEKDIGCHGNPGGATD
jgi:hypothetical protein